MTPKKKPRRKGFKAKYGDATPDQVAQAFLRYRPGERAGEVREEAPEYVAESEEEPASE